MQKKTKRLAPDNITELSQCEVFVFGSNLEGQHMGGAARYAYDHFGAEWGNGVGPQGVERHATPTTILAQSGATELDRRANATQSRRCTDRCPKSNLMWMIS